MKTSGQERERKKYEREEDRRGEQITTKETFTA